MEFEWDFRKDKSNYAKHGITFELAQYAFADPKRIIARDRMHSKPGEIRYFCYGKIDGRIVTVRFTYRGNKIRLFGAGYWREGKTIYEQENKLRQSAERSNQGDRTR